MTTATDIASLKSRCTALEKRATAVESKNTAQDTSLAAIKSAATALSARVATLEAKTPVDYSAQISQLRKEVDTLMAQVYELYNEGHAPPVITSLSASHAAPGASLTIYGTGFGSSQGTSTVKVGGVTATVTNWSAQGTQVTVTVPTAVGSGVYVTVGVNISNTYIFTVDSSTVFNVMSYSPPADPATQDCTACIGRAVAAAGSGGTIYFPAGTYYLASAYAPTATVNFTGAGMVSTWIKGRIDFGSNQSFTDLKIGPGASDMSLWHANGATNTSFTRVAFHGGKNYVGWLDPNVAFGYGRSCSFVTFTDCEFECASGTSNIVHLDIDRTEIVHDLTFTRCHFGTSNGTRSGSNRYMVENYMVDGQATHAYYNLTYSYCIFEPSDMHSLDFSDSELYPSYGITVDHCTFKGAGLNPGIYGGSEVCIELGRGAIITNNTFYRSNDKAIGMSDHGWSHTAGGARPACQITGNTFDFDTDLGLGTGYGNQPFGFFGDNIVFTGNTITDHNDPWYEFSLYGVNGGTFTGNTMYLQTTAPSREGCVFFGYPAGSYTNGLSDHLCSGNTFTGNTITKHASIALTGGTV